MKRAAFLAALLLLVSAPAARADTLRVEGSIVNGTTGRPPPADLDVEIAVVSSDGSRIDSVRTKAGDKGRFSTPVEFEPGARTVVSSRFAGITYSTIARAGTSVARAELRVFETTRDASVITVDANTTVLEPAGSGDLEALHIVRMTNNSDRTFIGPPGDSAAFRLPLAAGAFSVRVVNGLTPGRAQPQAGALEAGDPLQPGDATVSYAYKLRGDESAWSFDARTYYVTERSDVLIPPELELAGGDFRLLDEINFGGDSYRQYVRNNLEQGEAIAFTLEGKAGAGPWPFVAGAVALFFLLILVWRVGRARSRSPDSSTHQEVVTAIAALDVAHESGDVEDDEYTARRAELKKRLERAGS
jgi:uncharacterized membrane protein